MSETEDEKTKERPHGHRDRGKTGEGPHKDDVDSSERRDGPDSANVDGDENLPYPKGR